MPTEPIHASRIPLYSEGNTPILFFMDPPLASWTRSYDNRFWKKGIVDKPLERTGSIQLEQFKFAQSLTEKPVKAVLTGATTLANWNFDKYYKNRERFVLAWAKVIQEEAFALEEAGAKVELV